MTDRGLDALVDDLEAEHRVLHDLLAGISDDDWLRPTPAWQWDVRDTVAHLADTDEMAMATMHGLPGSLSERSAVSAAGEDVTYAGVLKGRRMRGADVFAWWERTTTTERAALRAHDPSERVPWGIGMSAPAFVTARMMESWAHALDVHAALGVEPVDTMRLAHVAWLATRALPYAFTVAGIEQPAVPLYVELTLPDGSPWTMGPADAADRITGPAGQYCRIFVQRLAPQDARDVVAEGDAALLTLSVARAYL
jgi:uncharacterized protein (TIGR03084 family)